MNFLRKHWPDVGGLIALSVCIYLILDWKNIPTIKSILWLSFVAILVHQFEEYRWPGYMPGIFNVVLSKSDMPDRYPLNSNSAMIINTIIAIVTYLVPVFFYRIVWLGLAAMFLGFAQFIVHGIITNKAAKTIYNPGLFAVVFLHYPIGIYYIYFIVSRNLVTPIDWILAVIYTVLTAYLFLNKMNVWMKDRNTKYIFSTDQLGPYSQKNKRTGDAPMDMR